MVDSSVAAAKQAITAAEGEGHLGGLHWRGRLGGLHRRGRGTTRWVAPKGRGTS